jgi:hypothetical protein
MPDPGPYRSSAEPVVRYEHQAPDELHIDIKKLGASCGQSPGHR